MHQGSGDGAKNTNVNKLDEETRRRLAVKADVDPRTLMKAYRGEPVRGMSGRRARAVLVEAGLLAQG